MFSHVVTLTSSGNHGWVPQWQLISNGRRPFIVAAMQVVFALETLPLSVLSCPSGVAAANFSLVLLAPAAWRSAQQVSFERFSSLWWLLKRCRESQPSSKMVLHRFSLACYALIVLRRLLCSLHVPAVTGLPSLQSLSAANFFTAFECFRSLRHFLSSLSSARCLCALALASCRP